MAFLLTTIYIVLSHLSPADLLPSLADYRILVWIGCAATAAVAWPYAFNPSLWHLPQLYLMLAFTAVMPLSRMVHLWFGGAWPALSGFLVSGIVFFLVTGSANSIRKIQLLAAALVLTGLWLLSQSLYGFYVDGDSSQYVIQQLVTSAQGEVVSTFPRLRSVGIVQDPNDFSQFLLVCMSLLAMAWRPGRRLANLTLVILPGAYMLYGIYATRSRGAVIGLGMLVFLLLEKRLSRKMSIVLTAGILALLMLSDVAGGRAFSLSEGSAAGRVEEWGAGIGMLKASPLFGVGYDLFLNQQDLTAHNSFVLCFAELGVVGYLLWLGLIVSTVTGLNGILRDTAEQEPETVRCARVVRAALFVFLVTAWFLSRTYAVTLYVLFGMCTALIWLVQNGTEIQPEPAQPRWRLTAGLAVASILVVYAAVRLKNF